MLPEPITALTAALAKLPGIGPRSAERVALHLVQTDPAIVRLVKSERRSSASGRRARMSDETHGRTEGWWRNQLPAARAGRASGAGRGAAIMAVTATMGEINPSWARLPFILPQPDV